MLMQKLPQQEPKCVLLICSSARGHLVGDPLPGVVAFTLLHQHFHLNNYLALTPILLRWTLTKSSDILDPQVHKTSYSGRGL